MGEPEGRVEPGGERARPRTMVDDEWPIGWFSPQESVMYQAEATRVRRGVVVEVGVYLGRSLSRVAAICRANGSRLVAIDNWEGCLELREVGKPLRLLEGLRANLEWLHIWDAVEPMTGDSAGSAKNFADGSVDLVFIDATHFYAPVKSDIGAWWPKVRPGGVMLGHDYHKGFPGLVRAVNEVFGKPDALGGSVWKVVKSSGRMRKG